MILLMLSEKLTRERELEDLEMLPVLVFMHQSFNSIEGGAVCFRDRQLGEKRYDLKNFGIHGPEEVFAVGQMPR